MQYVSPPVRQARSQGRERFFLHEDKPSHSGLKQPPPHNINRTYIPPTRRPCPGLASRHVCLVDDKLTCSASAFYRSEGEAVVHTTTKTHEKGTTSTGSFGCSRCMCVEPGTSDWICLDSSTSIISRLGKIGNDVGTCV